MSLEEVNYGSFEPSEFDDFVQGQMKRIALAQNGEVKGVHHSDNTNKWDDDSDVDWEEYENNRWNCMVQIPKFYYRTFREEYKDLDTYRCEITTTKRQGFKLHPAFMRNGLERDFQYFSAFEGWLDGDGKLRSLPNKDVTTSRSLSQFRSDAFQNGDNFILQDIYLTSAIQMLFIVEYGGFDSQNLLAEGNVSSNYVKTGKSLETGNKSGGDNTWMSYRGIENFYANYYKALDGLNIKDRKMYIATDTNFESDKFDENYLDSGFTVPTSGYIKDFGFSEDVDFLFLPTKGGASSDTHLASRVVSATGDRVAFFGGYRDDASGCGCFMLYLYRAAGGSHANSAARLCFA